jgi:phospholipid transport system substrate-binding protein
LRRTGETEEGSFAGKEEGNHMRSAVTSMPASRRASILALICALFVAGVAPAAAQNAAEQFVGSNIRTGLGILNDTSLDASARSARFETFLLDNTDLNRIALFTLGNAQATPQQREAFTAAFRGYAIATYRSYFRNYSGQSLRVTGSRQNAPGDTIVRTELNDPGGARPLAVDFRVRTDGAKPVVVDIGISGVWLALTQRDDFAAFLARNNGDVAALTDYLTTRTKSLL